MHHKRAKPAEQPYADAAFDADVDLTMAPAPRFDRPVGADNTVFTSPVNNARTPNDQEMQSGADETSGVHDSDVSGGDYSREQGVGRPPNFRWPWNIHSVAHNFASLSRWNLERAGQGLMNPHSGLNPFYGVPQPAYSPITAMDQYTTFYENDPDQWQHFGPGPISIPESAAPAYTEVAVLGGAQ